MRDELARDGWHEETRLILITTSNVTGLTGTDSVAMTDEEAEDLSTQLGVRDHPYAWLIHEGRLRVGGVVNTPAHLKQLLDLASVGQAESTRHGEPE